MSIPSLHCPVVPTSVPSASMMASSKNAAGCARHTRIQRHLVVPALLDILQAGAAAQPVVRDPEHVIRFVIWQVHLQHRHVPIERLDQPRVLRQLRHRPDPTSRQPAHPIAVLVLDVAGSVPRRRLRRPARAESHGGRRAERGGRA